jgi:hypothetical protein
VCQMYRTVELFLEPGLFAALWSHSGVHGRKDRRLSPRSFLSWGEKYVKKIVIAVGATLALVTAASAADLPRREPVPAYPAAPIGKMPIGKTPIGKTPLGKTPIAPRY